MSHNPNTVKSQDDINEGGRKSDVLVATLEKCERLQKQLEIAVNLLKKIRAKIKTVYDIDLRRFETTGGFDTYFVEEIDHKIKELDNEIHKQE